MEGDPGVVEMVTSFESFKVCGLRAPGTEGGFCELRALGTEEDRVLEDHG